MKESQSAAERSQTELQSLMAHLIQVGARIQSLDHLKDEAVKKAIPQNEVFFAGLELPRIKIVEI